MKELAYDEHMSPDFAGWIRSKGLPVTAVAQGYQLSSAIHKLEWLVRNQKFLYHGHPIARWCFSNVVLDLGVKDVRLAKGKSREKIDLVAAAATAMDLIIKTPIAPKLTGNIRFIEWGESNDEQ
jgi:phage terminase large subunit-like protein